MDNLERKFDKDLKKEFQQLGKLGKQFKGMQEVVEEKREKVEERGHGDEELKEILKAISEMEHLIQKMRREFEKADQEIDQGNDKQGAKSAGEAMYAARELQNHMETIYQHAILVDESLADEISRTISSLSQIADELEQFKESEGVKTARERVNEKT